MSQVIIIKDNHPDIKLYTRSATLGSEYDLMWQFIEYYQSTFIRNNKRNRLAIFVEPRIDSGFPDVVCASYLPSIIDNWSEKRELLDTSDLKLLSYLHTAGITAGTKIISTLGFTERKTLMSLEKLMDAKLILYKNHGWQIRKLRDFFSLTKLIAIEAKLNNIHRVIEQTHRNTRFASHSYALTNSMYPQKATIDTFKKFGLGLYGKGPKFHRIVEAKPICFPSSYVSFQFNEWIGNTLSHQKGV